MFGFISGYSDTDDINYCPLCGDEDLEHDIDGTAKCLSCGFAFGVIETEESERKAPTEEVSE